MVMYIRGFFDEYRFLSNFWMAEVEFEGLRYPSVEHGYQAAKTLDIHERVYISGLPTAGKAKRRGSKVVLRADWEQVKLGIMEELVRQKFTRHECLKQKLLVTAQLRLVEENSWGDTFWGVCRGEGKNHLGEILMKVREELRPKTLSCSICEGRGFVQDYENSWRCWACNKEEA